MSRDYHITLVKFIEVIGDIASIRSDFWVIMLDITIIVNLYACTIYKPKITAETKEKQK